MGFGGNAELTLSCLSASSLVRSHASSYGVAPLSFSTMAPSGARRSKPEPALPCEPKGCPFAKWYAPSPPGKCRDISRSRRHVLERSVGARRAVRAQVQAVLLSRRAQTLAGARLWDGAGSPKTVPPQSEFARPLLHFERAPTNFKHPLALIRARSALIFPRGRLNLERALLKFKQPPARTEKSVQLFRNPQ